MTHSAANRLVFVQFEEPGFT